MIEKGSASIERYLPTTEKLTRRKIRSHYEERSEFEIGRIIRLKEAGRANRRIVCHMGRNDKGFRRCWQEWVGKGNFRVMMVAVAIGSHQIRRTD
ncbi:hypothetical protein TNCV_3795931 [Trichonephila clavipes]|nr:hypothetical protein TNCV_3795931 [Trichonephila clavipes]